MASALRSAMLRHNRVPVTETLTLKGSKWSLFNTVRSMSSHGEDHITNEEVVHRVLDVVKSFPKVNPSTTHSKDLERPQNKIHISMASTALSRNPTLGCIYRSLATKINLPQLRSTNPPFRPFHGFPPQSLLRPPLPQMEIRGFQSYLNIYRRFLCSSTSTATVSQASSSTSGSSEGNSGNDDKSDQSQNTSEQGKSVRGGPVSWLSFLLLVATGAGLIFYYDNEKRRHIEDIINASIAVKQGPSVGKAAIGGPFSLVNHNGKAVTDRDLLGKWTVMYFGFTHCPDICPDELQKLAAAVDKIKKNAGIEVVPVFISVDPERDTVEQVHEYVKEFHPNLIGLTGNPEEIKKVARAYRVYYMKTEEEGSDYLVDHSIVMYLMDPNMEFVKFYGKNNDVDALSDGISKEIKQYKNAKS